jgi:hypothetical protein
VAPDVLAFCGGLVENVPVYELEFTPTADVVEVLEEHVRSVSDQ